MMGIRKRGIVRKRRTPDQGPAGRTAAPAPASVSASAPAFADLRRGRAPPAVTFHSVQDPFAGPLGTGYLSSSSTDSAAAAAAVSSTTSISPLSSPALDLELISKLKRSRISQTPGQLRLEAGVKECRKRFTSGYVDVYMERHSPDLVNIIIKRAFPRSKRLATLRFVAKAPKFYPHAPLAVSLIGDLPDFPVSPFLAIDRDTREVMFRVLQKDTWSCVLSLYDVAINLVCLVYEPEFQLPQQRQVESSEMDVDMGESGGGGGGCGGSGGSGGSGGGSSGGSGTREYGGASIIETTERYKRANMERFQQIVSMLPPLAHQSLKNQFEQRRRRGGCSAAEEDEEEDL
jgi:hypothetical protein